MYVYTYVCVCVCGIFVCSGEYSVCIYVCVVYLYIVISTARAEDSRRWDIHTYIHTYRGELPWRDSGLWVMGFDSRRLADLKGQEVEQFDQAEPIECLSKHCHMPWYFPL